MSIPSSQRGISFSNSSSPLSPCTSSIAVPLSKFLRHSTGFLRGVNKYKSKNKNARRHQCFYVWRWGIGHELLTRILRSQAYSNSAKYSRPRLSSSSPPRRELPSFDSLIYFHSTRKNSHEGSIFMCCGDGESPSTKSVATDLSRHRLACFVCSQNRAPSFDSPAQVKQFTCSSPPNKNGSHKVSSILFGGDGGNRTPVRNVLACASTTRSSV
jgi:hypothetical protein